jgi:hypothetical protein
MRPKHAAAFRALLATASAVGDHLQERWVDVLRCISRWAAGSGGLDRMHAVALWDALATPARLDILFYLFLTSAQLEAGVDDWLALKASLQTL